ncbi:hypothetical protein [Umezawaea tangerina]|uniref:hypothetical protein n=1 Tax=Umezawaea tangerina TaxID=84725 RepID=UPI0011B1F07B|nr:hypothetical protein [Umezawaea tangerina]
MTVGLLAGPVIASTTSRAAHGEPLFAGRWWLPKVGEGAAVSTAVTTTTLALVDCRFDGATVGPVWSWFAVTGILLTQIDLVCHRLPRFVVGAMFAGGLLLAGNDALLRDDPRTLLEALSAAAIVFTSALLFALIVAPRVGAGDVLLVGTTSFYLGLNGWSAVALGLVLSLVLAAAAAALLVLVRRVGPGDPIALGPAIIGGALLVAAFP